jgi:hypothetical protein
VKSIFFGLAWLLLSVGVIMTSVAAVSFYEISSESFFRESNYKGVLITSDNNSSSHDGVLGTSTIVETDDARALLVTNFLKRYNGKLDSNLNLNHPLVPEEYYGQFFIEIADKYEMDFRLLPAIAMQESNLCKVTPKPGGVESYNCLGLGVHSRGTWMFPSYEANLDQAAKILKENYIDRGLVTPEQIMKKYTPSSPGTWASSVNQWMTEMRYNDRSSGIQLKENADLLEFIDDNGESEEVETDLDN